VVPAGEYRERLPYRAQPIREFVRLSSVVRATSRRIDKQFHRFKLIGNAQTFVSVVVDDPATQAGIIRLLKEKGEEVKDEMSSDPLLAVVQALFAICHREKQISVYAAEVAEAAGPILEQRGELLVSPRTVGNQLRNLGFIPQCLDSKGRGLVLNAKVRKQIHYLARDYKILPYDNGDPGCNDCIEVRNARETE
jgi:hypothetical protein